MDLLGYDLGTIGSLWSHRGATALRCPVRVVAPEPLARVPCASKASTNSGSYPAPAISTRRSRTPLLFDEGLAYGLQSHTTNRIEPHPGSREPLRISRASRTNIENGTGVMKRALRIIKTVGSLLAIEIFVPGGTLIVLALLLTGRSGSPFVGTLAKRIPVLSRVLPRTT
jgi:hypothetical protein